MLARTPAAPPVKVPLASIDVDRSASRSRPLSLGEPIDWAVEGHSDRFRYPAHHGPRNGGASGVGPAASSRIPFTSLDDVAVFSM